MPLTPATKAALRVVLSEIARAQMRAAQPSSRGLASTTPCERFTNIVKDEVRRGVLSEQALVDVALLLSSAREKRRLTIDWRGTMMTTEELVDATARRVGLVAPRIMDNEWRKGPLA